MPTISMPSKIAATQALTPHVIFSGSTSQEREAKVEEVIKETGAVLIPPYDHGDIILGQGTVGKEMEEQFAARREGQVCTVHDPVDRDQLLEQGQDPHSQTTSERHARFVRPKRQLDAIIAPCGGGGLLSGIATYFADHLDRDDSSSSSPPTTATRTASSGSADTPSHQPSIFSLGTTPSTLLGQQDEYRHYPSPHPPPPPPPQAPQPKFQQASPIPSQGNSGRRRSPLIFAAEPSHQGADDARRSLAQGSRIESVKSLTIADGLRTPLGVLNWEVVRDARMVHGIYSVTEGEIKDAMRGLLERAKMVVEPSAAVALAVVLWDEGFRGLVQKRQLQEMRQPGKEEVRPWDVGVVVSGGNTTVEAIAKLFSPHAQEVESGDGTGEVQKGEREEGTVRMRGERTAENVAG
jgi:threonine dehydratase